MEIRPILDSDRTEILEIYNHYIVHTTATFDTVPFDLDGRAPWFEQFDDKRYVCLVAYENKQLLGYANSAKLKEKPAYQTSVEVSIYTHPKHRGKGCGDALYTALFDHLADEDVHRAYAGITQPNPASEKLHKRFDFEPCGYYQEVGYKFGQYWDVRWMERPL